MTATRLQTKFPQLLHLIGSDVADPKQSVPLSSVADFTIRPKERLHPQHSLFDTGLISPAWYVTPSPNKSRLRFWLKRKHYQYEVTWGLYVLTLGEKSHHQ
jgi:Small subunit of serine palmitoyltransferase-like